MTDEKKRYPFTKEGIAAFNANLWQPQLDQRFKDAIPLLAELSGADEDWWIRAMSGIPAWAARVEFGLEMDAEWLRALGSGLLADLMLAHVGKAPPPELAREFDRRVTTVREVRHPADANHIDTDEAAEHYFRAWTAIKKVVAATNPEVPKQ